MDRYYWWCLGGVVAIPFLLWGCGQYNASQERIARAGNPASAPMVTETAPPPVVDGIPDPLQPLPLSSGAAWVLGAEYQKNDRGEVVGFSDLPPTRSAAVLAALLKDVDLCSVYLSLGATAEVVVSMTPVPGSYPLIDSAAEMCALPAFVPTPQDPMPPTSTTVAGA